MIFSIDDNIFTKIYIDILNKYEDYTTKVWNSNSKHSATCRQCGQRITPANCKYSPDACGWRKLKNANGLPGERYEWGWLCHSCDGHFEEHFINIKDLSDMEFQYLKKKGVIPKYVLRL